MEASQESSLSGVYRGIDNLTQFINEIQLSQTDQARRLKVIEANVVITDNIYGINTTPQAKPRSKTIDAGPPNEPGKKNNFRDFFYLKLIQSHHFLGNFIISQVVTNF